MTEISQEDRDHVKANSKHDVNVTANAQGKISPLKGEAGVSNSRETGKDATTNVSFTYINILGGRPTGDPSDEDAYLQWIKSIPENPMPIRSQLAPISKLFRSEELKEAYDEAMEFYMELKGVKVT